MQESQARQEVENKFFGDMRRLVLEFNDQIAKEMPDPPTVDRLLGANFEAMEEEWRRTSAVQDVVAITWQEAAFNSLQGMNDAIRALEM